MSLDFDSSYNARITEQRTTLVNLEGEKIKARMAEAAAICAKIGNIYGRYLNPWFERVLNDEENQEMKSLFSDISDTHTGMVKGIERLAEWIGNKATVTLDMVDE